MKSSTVLYQNKKITITEGTIFYPLSIIIGTPLIWFTTKALGIHIPIWSNFCYLFFCDTSVKIYKSRSINTLKIAWVSSALTIAATMIFQDNIIRSVFSLVGFMLYKNTFSERLGPFMFGYINIAILTASPYMGIVDKPTFEAILQILSTGSQTIIGFLFSILFMSLYHNGKKLILRSIYE